MRKLTDPSPYAEEYVANPIDTHAWDQEQQMTAAYWLCEHLLATPEHNQSTSKKWT